MKDEHYCQVRVKASIYSDLKWLSRDLHMSIQDLLNSFLQEKLNTEKESNGQR